MRSARKSGGVGADLRRTAAGSADCCRVGIVRIDRARDAKRSELWLSSQCRDAGVTLHTIIESALPPSEFCRMRVILDERYGMCAWPLAPDLPAISESLLMTVDSTSRLLLICPPSCSRTSRPPGDAPGLRTCGELRSEPAKST
eukprot:6200004-Pleurochrysis_carterae.AAC.1